MVEKVTHIERTTTRLLQMHPWAEAINVALAFQRKHDPADPRFEFWKAVVERIKRVEYGPKADMKARKNMPKDIVLETMKRERIPMTRANYLHIAYLGTPPDEPLDGELEAELPEIFRKWDDDGNEQAPA